MRIIKTVIERFGKLDDRSQRSMVNIMLSFFAKGINIITQLLIVPLTINYVNPTKYGIWLTLSSVIAWIGFFDLGLGNGMRNKVAEAKAKGELALARSYVSTAYFAIGVVVLVLFAIAQIVNLVVIWPVIFKVDVAYTVELRKVFSILASFFCLNMVVKLFSSLLTADQKPGVVSCIGVAGQLLSLLVIFILTKVSDGSLVRLAAFYSGIPTIVLLIVSLIAFRYTSYRQFAPRLRFVRMDLIREIMRIGIQFFIIYLCMLVVFQVINLVISRELGPESVTEYNVANKYFNIAYSLMLIILTPFWSAFTDAFHKKDFVWMRKVKRMLESFWLCEIAVVILMVIIAPRFYDLWVGDSVSVDSRLTIGMALFTLSQSIGAVYMNLINGVGTVRIQLAVYLFFAFISWPLMQYACRAFGIIGILVAPTMLYIVQALLGKIQMEKILDGSNTGVWSK